MGQRGDAIFVRQVEIGTRRNQLAHDVLVARAAVGQHDGFDQAGPAQAVDMIWGDTGGEQGAHGLHMAALASRNQRRAAKAVGAFQVSAVRERHAQNLQPSLRASQQVGAVIHCIFQIRISTVEQQRARHFNVVARRCQQQRGAALLILHIDRRTLFEGRAHLLNVAHARRCQQFPAQGGAGLRALIFGG